MKLDLYPLETESDNQLLVRLIEECAEVQKECCKALRFGLDSFHPRDADRRQNRVRIANELFDVEKLIDELRARGIIP